MNLALATSIATQATVKNLKPVVVVVVVVMSARSQRHSWRQANQLPFWRPAAKRENNGSQRIHAIVERITAQRCGACLMGCRPSSYVLRKMPQRMPLRL